MNNFVLFEECRTSHDQQQSEAVINNISSTIAMSRGEGRGE